MRHFPRHRRYRPGIRRYSPRLRRYISGIRRYKIRIFPRFCWLFDLPAAIRDSNSALHGRERPWGSRGFSKNWLCPPPARSHPRLFLRNRILEPNGDVAPDGLDSSLKSGLKKKLFARFPRPQAHISSMAPRPRWRRQPVIRIVRLRRPASRFLNGRRLARAATRQAPSPAFRACRRRRACYAEFLTCLMASMCDSDGSQIRMAL
jgi:hypothetical protein